MEEAADPGAARAYWGTVFETSWASIRSQRFTDHAEESADFVEFLGLAGLGQAEASAITLADIDWPNNRFGVRQQKTGALFFVPIYPELRPLLERITRRLGRGSANRLFSIRDAKNSLQAACERLGYPRFSQRCIRRFHLGRLWRSGVDRKLIAKWQGHRDGGKLIIDTYTEMFGGDDAEYERHELAKLQRAR